MANTNAYNYGTGLAGQFTDGTQRQILELGDKIHMYNPDMTPLLTLGGRVGTNVTPVPIFEWMEDEWFTLKSITQAVVTETAGAKATGTNVGDTATGGVNGLNSIIEFDRQSAVEYFEVGALYAASLTEATIQAGVTHVLCVAIGANCNLLAAADSHRNVQFVGAHLKAGDETTLVQIEASASDLFPKATDAVLTLTYTGNLGAYDAGAYSGKDGLFQAETAFVDDKEFAYYPALAGWNEGAKIGMDTSKKVRRLKNCTQIFREPYTITGTMMNSAHYGGDELSRLQARKLAKFKTDIEWSLLTNGDVDLDADVENPKRTFAGFALNGAGTTGVVKSLNGIANTDLQLNYSSGDIDAFDDVCSAIFQDMVGGVQSKTVFCSNKWIRKISAMTRSDGTMNVEMGTNATAGLRVTKFHGAVGDLDFIVHPMLNGALENMALVIDWTNFAWRPLSGRDVQLRSDVVQDGRDGRTDEWLMEGGPEVRNEQTHAILKLV